MTESNHMPGMGWSLVCLVLHIAELLVLTEIVFFDSQRGAVSHKPGLIEFYFAATLIMTSAFAVGMWLVVKGYHHAGGLLQVIAIAPQVLKLDGILGVIGGLKAMRHARAKEADASS